MSLENDSSRSVISELSCHVRSHSKTRIIHCLNRIKNEPKILDSLIKNEGLDILVKLLRFQNTKILDATLSILANAFLKQSVREKVGEAKIACNVVWIIKTLASGITLHCRACRLIGNMAESRRHVKALLKAGVVGALASILKSQTNAQTLSMAVRAVRNIWSHDEESHDEILEHSIVETIMTLLTTSRSKLLEDKYSSKYKQLEENCFKALMVFSDSSRAQLAEQISGKKGLVGFRCIIDYCKSNNQMAFQILHKLSKAANIRPDLGNADAVEFLVNFLETKRHDSLSSSLNYEAITCLCLFSREAINRVRIRNSGGLELMLKLLEDPDKDNYHPNLLYAFIDFRYDVESISIMSRNGIVSILASKLQRMVLDVQLNANDDPVNNVGRGKPKRRRPYYMFSPCRSREGGIKFNKPCNGRYSLDINSSQWSPSSANSSSPSTSPSLPSNDNETDVECNEDENYSPVCSDSEDWGDNEEHDSTTTQEEVESLSSYMSSHAATVTSYSDMSDYRDLEIPMIHTYTLLLLNILTLSNDPIEGLANPTTIQALTTYIKASNDVQAPVVLTKIIEKHVYFLPILLQGFVFEAQLLNHSQKYLQILCGIAESGGAFGELATTLLRGQDSHKFMVAVSVPFILKSKDKLRKLLSDYGGLPLIFKLLANRAHSLHENSVLSICQLAEVLGIIPTTTDISSPVSEFVDGIRATNIVTFELDDGGSVDVFKDLLCNKSEYFTAMLEGQFLEGGQKQVRLRNASRAGFSTLCLAASGQLFKDDLGEDDPAIESLLDAVLLADKYLMFDELERLTETSMSRLNNGNIIRAWNWARNNDCPDLKICCVKNFLTSRLSRESRLDVFRNFSSDVNFKEFLDDINAIITQYWVTPKNL